MPVGRVRRESRLQFGKVHVDVVSAVRRAGKDGALLVLSAGPDRHLLVRETGGGLYVLGLGGALFRSVLSGCQRGQQDGEIAARDHVTESSRRVWRGGQSCPRTLFQRVPPPEKAAAAKIDRPTIYRFVISATSWSSAAPQPCWKPISSCRFVVASSPWIAIAVYLVPEPSRSILMIAVKYNCAQPVSALRSIGR